MKKLTILFTLLFTSITAFGQAHQINPQDSEVKVTGTSTIHDWDVNAQEFGGSGNFEIGNGELISVSNLKLSVKVNSIKSGKGAMDKKIYEALKEKNHKEIIFAGKGVEEISGGKIFVNGDLTIAGVTKSITLEADYEILPDNSLIFTGSYPISMKEFGMNPPTAMFGSIKTGNDVRVHFNTTFSTSSNS